MKRILIIVFFLCALWPTIAPAGYLSTMMADANEGGSGLGFIFLFITLYLIGVVCLFFGCLVKFRNHSSTPNYFKTCFRIATDAAGEFIGTAFFLHIICTIALIIVYAIVLMIISKEMTIGGFITVVAIGFTCSIVVALSICLLRIKAGEYFQNIPNAKSYDDDTIKEQQPPPIIETEVKTDSPSEGSSYTKNSERKTFKWNSNYTVFGILIVSVAAFIFFVIFGPRQAEKPKTQEAPPVMTEEMKNDFISQYIKDLFPGVDYNESSVDKYPATAVSAKVNKYTFKVRNKSDKAVCMDYFKSGKKLRSDCDSSGFRNAFYIVTTPNPGTDINGDGLPELIVQKYSGGAHCCFAYDIFSLGKNLKLIDTLFGRHSYFNFKDLDNDGKYEAIGRDWIFAYWSGSFAGSPAPEVILHWRNGKYRLAGHLMKKTPPLEADLYNKIPYIYSESETYTVVSAVMIKLIYTGNGNLALKYCDWFWQNLDQKIPKQKLINQKNEFLADFKKQLKGSLYWPELKKINGW